jgi:hypothetical protein
MVVKEIKIIRRSQGRWWGKRVEGGVWGNIMHSCMKMEK